MHRLVLPPADFKDWNEWLVELVRRHGEDGAEAILLDRAQGAA
mgnify:CR=1 FL=1